MSRSQFRIKGLNQEKVFNSLSKEVKVYNIKRESHDKATFEVDSKYEKKTKSLLSGCGLEVEVLGSKGFTKKILNLFKNYGIILGIVLSLIFYLVQYSLVLKVEVWGSVTLPKEEIEMFTNSILPSRFKSKINTKLIESEIKDKYSLASSVSVAIIGQSLIVNLNEGVLPSEMGGEFRPLVSDYDGLVTSINLIQGTLNVKVGDIVQKGDVLVCPYIIDTDGQERKVKPKADIEAEIWIQKQYCHKDYVVKTQRTGNKVVSSKVMLSGKVIYSHNKEAHFKNYEIENEQRDLTTNNLIPFKLERTVYYELETVEISKPFYENKEEIINLARENVLIFLQKNEIIKEEKYFVREGGGCYFIDYIVTTSRNIGG